MKNICSGSKAEEYSIDDKVVVTLNPGDTRFIERFDAAFRKLAEYQAELAEATQKEDAEFFAAAKAADTNMRDALNELFGTDICTPLWGDEYVHAMSDGLPVWFNLMLAFVDEIVAEAGAAKAARSARLAKYTEKYMKK